MGDPARAALKAVKKLKRKKWRNEKNVNPTK
jgi:hypothetical protein